MNWELIKPHWFWWALTMACVVWYSIVTGYVAVKGGLDIRSMLRRLSSLGNDESAA